MNSLDRILDEAMALPPSQQEMLVQILQRRLVEHRRDEIARAGGYRVSLLCDSFA